MKRDGGPGVAGRLLWAAAGYVAALLVGALVNGVLIAAAGGDVVTAYRTLVQSSLGSLLGLAQTLNRMTPILLGSLGVAVGLRAGLFNIGVDGQIYLGAIFATGLAFAIAGAPVPMPVFVGLVLVAGLVGGALLGGFAGALRAYWGVNEIFVTVMLNFVMVSLTDYLATGPWNDPMAGEAITLPIPDAAVLPMLLPTAGMHAGILLALIAAVVVWLVLQRTVLGFEILATGDNPRAARVAGIDVRRTMLVALSVSGGLAGLAGAIEVSGYHNRLILGLSPNYGVMALLTSVLGGNTPAGIIAASFAVAVLLVGSDSLQRSVGLPASAALVFQAIVVLAVLLAESAFRRFAGGRR